MNKGVIFINAVIPILVIFTVGVLMPILTRKEIFFGVRIPYDRAGNEALNSFKAKYYREYVSIMGIYTIIFGYLVFNYPENQFIYVPGIFIMIGLSSVIYYKTHSSVKAFKKKQGWTIGKKETVVIDTSFRGEKNRKILVSPLWFLIPFAIIALNIVLGLINYDSLPDKIPMHFNIMGEVDRWADKSLGVVLELPMMQLFITGIMYFTYKSMGWVKQQINPSNVEESMHQNREYRRKWSAYAIYMNICVVVLFSVINFNTMKIINMKGVTLSLAIGGITLLMLISTIVLAIYTGQGGSRIKLQKSSDENPSLMDREDDRHWKLGMFYFNPNDPAVWVEKRFGIGLTVNFGRPLGIIILVGIIAFAMLIPLITGLLE